MAEHLIVVEDTQTQDVYLKAVRPQRGDTIDVKENGSAWGKAELSDPRWRIIRTPMSVSEARAFEAREKQTDPSQPSKTLQYRAFKLDVDALAAADPEFAAWLADDKRSLPIYECKHAIAALRAAKVVRPKIDDPAIIGTPMNVIG